MCVGVCVGGGEGRDGDDRQMILKGCYTEQNYFV